MVFVEKIILGSFFPVNLIFDAFIFKKFIYVYKITFYRSVMKRLISFWQSCTRLVTALSCYSECLNDLKSILFYCIFPNIIFW